MWVTRVETSGGAGRLASQPCLPAKREQRISRIPERRGAGDGSDQNARVPRHRRPEMTDTPELPRRRRCMATAKSGNTCRAYALHDGNFCLAHDPRPAVAAVRDGGRARGRDATVAKWKNVRPEPVAVELPDLDPSDPAKVLEYRLALSKALAARQVEVPVAKLLLENATAARDDWVAANPSQGFDGGDLAREFRESLYRQDETSRSEVAEPGPRCSPAPEPASNQASRGGRAKHAKAEPVAPKTPAMAIKNGKPARKPPPAPAKPLFRDGTPIRPADPAAAVWWDAIYGDAYLPDGTLRRRRLG